MRRGLLSAMLALLPGSAGATVLFDWSLEDCVERADLVVIGVVGEKRSYRTGEHPLTNTEIQVERTLLGAHRPTVTLTQYGGQFGHILVQAPGDPKPNRGDRVLLILHRGPDGRHYLVGMSMGLYWLAGDRLTQNIDVARLSRAGNVLPPAGTRTRHLAEVEAIVRARPAR